MALQTDTALTATAGIEPAKAPPTGHEGVLPELGRFRQQLMKPPPSMADVLVAAARRWRFWLLLLAALIVFDIVVGRFLWVGVFVLVAAWPFVRAALGWRRLESRHRLLQAYALGHWDTVRVLAQALRGNGQDPQDFDLDVRLACIRAREQSLHEALAKVEPWRERLAGQPGLYDARVAAVLVAAGDTVGHLRAVMQAQQAQPQDPVRRLEGALAQARFGDAALAQQLLDGVAPEQVTAQARPFADWTRGLLQMRDVDGAAVATLGAAVDGLVQRSTRPELQPALWPAVALCTADLALALHQGGRDELARRHVAEVWPVLEMHATVPLLRMLDADGLLPERNPKNS